MENDCFDFLKSALFIFLHYDIYFFNNSETYVWLCCGSVILRAYTLSTSIVFMKFEANVFTT